MKKKWFTGAYFLGRTGSGNLHLALNEGGRPFYLVTGSHSGTWLQLWMNDSFSLRFLLGRYRRVALTEHRWIGDPVPFTFNTIFYRKKTA